MCLKVEGDFRKAQQAEAVESQANPGLGVAILGACAIDLNTNALELSSKVGKQLLLCSGREPYSFTIDYYRTPLNK